jgi:uncharacterized protein YbjT (DUF2867 family)
VKILLTGATGYIGGRLAPRLIARGHAVRCIVRDPSRLQGRGWRDDVDVVEGDVLRPGSLDDPMRGVEAAYYLVHSMAGGPDFHDRDIAAARNFAAAAARAGVGRIVYLGGLAGDQPGLSEHLRSRQQTGDALRSAGVPVTEFRAAVIVGSGSLSFEMIRYLTERLPVMVCPRWVFTRTQPIAVRDVLDYLEAALDVPESAGRVVEIGGADTVTYGDMMTTYAEVRGLRRWMLPVPVLTPRLSSYWVNFVTPIPATIARPLIDGLRNENIVRDRLAQQLFPGVRPVTYREAVRRALDRLETLEVETAWSDALSTSEGAAAPVVLTTLEGLVVEHRQRVVKARPDAIYRAFTALGGERGWLYMNWAWEVRGLLDRAVGGVGLRRGRRDPDVVRVGDALDFWRVEALEPGRSMRLRAEMRLPGKAWLQFEVTPAEGGGSTLAQTAFFAPRGLSGLLYWYGLYPIHGLIFSGLIDRVAALAERGETGDA